MYAKALHKIQKNIRTPNEGTCGYRKPSVSSWREMQCFGQRCTQAEQPQQPVSPAINDKKSDSGVNVPAGGIEQELKMKPEEEMEQQLPPGISESGEVVDMAAYEAWQQENHPDIQQQMQRREEVNINVHRERGEDVEPGDDF